MPEDQIISAEAFQDQYDYDADDSTNNSERLNDEELAILQAELAEACEQLISIRDFIRFAVTQLRNYDVVVA